MKQQELQRFRVQLSQEENKADCYICMFDGIDLKVKCVDNNDGTVNAYIKLNGCNPLHSMLLGNFKEECEFYTAISFEIKKEDQLNNKSMYSTVDKNYLNDFLEEIYSFVVENNVAATLDDKDISFWDF